MQTLVDDLKLMPLFRDDHSWEFRLPVNDEARAATAAFVNSRLPADMFVDVEIPLTPRQRSQLTRAIGFPSCGLARRWFCAGCVARRPQHRQHGARRRGPGGRRRAREGDDDGGGDADPRSGCGGQLGVVTGPTRGQGGSVDA